MLLADPRVDVNLGDKVTQLGEACSHPINESRSLIRVIFFEKMLITWWLLSRLGGRYSLTTWSTFSIRVVLNPSSWQEANPMYEETDDSLSEGEFESSWPCSIQKYCRVQRNWKFVPVQWEIGSHWPRSDADGEALAGSVKANQVWINLLESPLHWAGERKTPWVTAINTDEEKSGSVALRPVEIPPLYHIWRIPPAYSMFHHEFLAIGRLNSVLCLAPYRRLGKWAPGLDIIINYYYVCFCFLFG